MTTRKHDYFYKRNNLKHATGFLSPADYEKLKALAKDADKSLARYITRLLEKHIAEQWAQRSEEPMHRPHHQTKPHEPKESEKN